MQWVLGSMWVRYEDSHSCLRWRKKTTEDKFRESCSGSVHLIADISFCGYLEATICKHMFVIFRVFPFFTYPCLSSLVHIVLPLNFLLTRLSEAIPYTHFILLQSHCFFHTTHLTLAYKGRKVSSAENMHREIGDVYMFSVGQKLNPKHWIPEAFSFSDETFHSSLCKCTFKEAFPGLELMLFCMHMWWPGCLAFKLAGILIQTFPDTNIKLLHADRS